MIGAICGDESSFLVHTKILRRTVKLEVEVFLFELVTKIRQTHGNVKIVIVLDNHAAHRSKLVKAFFEREGIIPLFTPPYSSPLNAIEHAWFCVKNEWAKQMARVISVYDKTKFESDLDLVTRQVFSRFT